MHRRQALRITGAALLLTRLARAAEALPQSILPAEVAGVPLPRSKLALAAAGFAQRSCPDFLFNHCMRTFVFGALLLPPNRTYDADRAFVASALHDLGLLQPFESERSSFEIDGADAAEKFMLERHRPAAEADAVWHAVELHDGKWPLTVRQGPEAMLVALGAGADVDGLDPGSLEASRTAEVLAAFPRLQFKQRFTSLLIAHCERKPDSQRATWLEGMCRAHAPGNAVDSVERDIARANFSE